MDGLKKENFFTSTEDITEERETIFIKEEKMEFEEASANDDEFQVTEEMHSIKKNEIFIKDEEGILPIGLKCEEELNIEADNYSEGNEEGKLETKVDLQAHFPNKRIENFHSSTTTVCRKQDVCGQTDLLKANELYPCKVCDLTLLTLSLLKEHYLHIHTRKLFSCEYCEYVTEKALMIEKHQAEQHGGGKQFSCDFCEFKSELSSLLRTHKLIHVREEPFSCEYCDYKFLFSSNLSKHKLIHAEDKPFSCDQCKFKTGLPLLLKKHSVIHIDQKPHSCNKCEYKTRSLNSLKLHKFIHETSAPYSCDKCSYISLSYPELYKHKLGHSKEKLYCCGLCGIKFKKLTSISKHMSVHMREKSNS